MDARLVTTFYTPINLYLALRSSTEPHARVTRVLTCPFAQAGLVWDTAFDFQVADPYRTSFRFELMCVNNGAPGVPFVQRGMDLMLGWNEFPAALITMAVAPEGGSPLSDVFEQWLRLSATTPQLVQADVRICATAAAAGRAAPTPHATLPQWGQAQPQSQFAPATAQEQDVNAATVPTLACCYFLQGRCNRGARCAYLHADHGQPCHYQGHCRVGHQHRKPAQPRPAASDAPPPATNPDAALPKIRCGKRLFAGAQGTIYAFAGFDPPAASIARPKDWCVKVMACTGILASTSMEDLRDGALVDQEQLIDDAELHAMHLAAREVASLTHAGLVQYKFVELSPSRSCLKLLMPLFAGDLMHWLGPRRQVSEKSLLHIVHELASAMAYLHEQSVSHLDLSLRNVLVDSLSSDTPHCVIIDMETATLAGRAPSPSFTYEFSAPERKRQPSAKCDVFSLGMIIYCVGALPDTPGLVEEVPELGTVTMNHEQLTPARIAAVVRRDLKHCECIVSLVTMMLNHDPRTRPSMPYVLQNIVALRENKSKEVSLQFPFVCGPFDLVPLPGKDLESIEVYHASLMYDAHAACCRCKKRRSESRRVRFDCTYRGGSDEMHLPGHVSPFRPSAVLPTCRVFGPGDGAEESRDANIGLYFVYPMYCDTSVTPASEVETLQLHGGFAFFRNEMDAGKSLSVRVLSPRTLKGPTGAGSITPDALYFTAAQPWPSFCTPNLAREGRIHREVPSMLGHARSFCWILPGEKFELENGETWIPATHGGFVFWFSEDPLVPNELDRYFAVSAPVAERSSRGKAMQRQGSSGGGGGVARVLTSIGGALRKLLTKPPHVLAAGVPSSPYSASSEGDLRMYGMLLWRPQLEMQIDDASPPRFIQIGLNGEFLALSHAVQVTPELLRRNPLLPPETRYLSFARSDMSHPRTSTTPQEPIFPQHGFVLFGLLPGSRRNSAFEVLAFVPFRIVAATSESSPPPPGSTCFPLSLAVRGTSKQYRGSMEPAPLPDLAATAFSSREVDIALTSERSEQWSFVQQETSQCAFIGYDPDTCCFYLSDESRSQWLMRQWPL